MCSLKTSYLHVFPSPLMFLSLFPSKKKSTTFCRGGSTPPSNFGPNWARKILETVLESSQKVREGISLTKNPKNAVNPAKNGRQNLSFCKCFVLFNFWRVLYYTRKTPSDFERSLWILYLRYWYHSSFILCIIAIKELLSHSKSFASLLCESKQ